MLGVPMRSRRDGTAQGLGDVHTVGGTATGAVGGGVVVKEHSHAQHTKVFSRVREAFWKKKVREGVLMTQQRVPMTLQRVKNRQFALEGHTVTLVTKGAALGQVRNAGVG